MGFFDSSTTANTVTNQTEAPNVTAFRNGLYPNIQQYFAQSQMPIYGQTQYGQQLNNFNDLANSSINQLSNTLAGRTGSLNSGAYASGVTNILNQRAQGLAGYNASVPMMNRQAQMSGMQNALQLWNQAAGPALRGSTSNTTTTNSPSMFSDIVSGIGAAAGIAGMPMFNNLFGSPQPQSPSNWAGGYGPSGAGSQYISQLGLPGYQQQLQNLQVTPWGSPP